MHKKRLKQKIEIECHLVVLRNKTNVADENTVKIPMKNFNANFSKLLLKMNKNLGISRDFRRSTF